MAESVYMKFNCLNPECGKTIQIKRPMETGTYAVTCPHCKVKKNLKIMGQDQYGKAEEPVLKATDNSSNEPIELEDDFFVEKDYSFKCPHCEKQEIGFNSSKPGMKDIACPHCKGRIKFEVRKKTEIIHVDEPSQNYRGKLTLLRRGWLNKEYRLTRGKYIIGREDYEYPSDISIRKDESVSRRSVMIEVQQTPKGFTFKLTVLKATNPVMHNNMPLMPGESISLNFGDSITMGRTRFRFDKDI